eukprot:CAMPEP_0183740320 /NCGR_PEP_ID=MMETSP0737-20130205/59286_1 /TAXON_ID=385413 /ORGANISM="Thalassiosira miniscula, Strain CCMP1093" /LENGTH=741 /DNA_ID=CAMNT_0025975345 /DNA_START=89 /DNA_END=2311 /DNA_ORIENTATION=-
MYHPNRQRQAPYGHPQVRQNNVYSSYGNDFSERTPSSQGFYSDRTPASRGPQSQYTGSYNTGAQSQYAGAQRMDYSVRTPSSQGGYSRGGYAQGGYNTGGAYADMPGTMNNSGAFQSRATNNDSVSSLGGGSVVRGRRPSNDSLSISNHSRQTQKYSDNASYCGSTATGGTTLANGGRGRCPYQVEFQVQNHGKQVSSSKRIISFRYGFANTISLSQGKTGIDCRGEEHDIIITWSITGGKRAIAMDGREIQYSAGKRANSARRADILEASWRMGDHIYDLRCYAYKPAAGSPEKRDPRWKQYTLIIDGRSFFELPQIFDLGLKGLRPVIHIQPSQIDSNPNSHVSAGSVSGSHEPSNPDPNVMKSAIQSRIIEQRKLMKERKQSVSEEKKQNLSHHEKAQKEKSLNADMESMGLESQGVQSAAPSELDEARNRKKSMPMPATPSLPALAAPPNNHGGTYEKQLTQYSNTGAHVTRPAVSAPPKQTNNQVARAAGFSGPPKPRQHQIQAQQTQNQPKAPHVKPPTMQQYQIQDNRNENQHDNQHQQSALKQPSQHEHKPANHTPQQQRYDPLSSQVDSPSPRNQNTTNMQQAQAGIEFLPQEPPTYDEITRDIMGAYDDSSAIVPMSRKSDGSVVTSNAGESSAESSLVPRSATSTLDDSSVMTSNMGESALVPRSSRGYTTSSEMVPSEMAPSEFDGSSIYSGDCSLAATRYTKFSAASKPKRRGSTAASSVDTRGVNKW